MFQLFAHGLEEGGKFDVHDYLTIFLAVVVVAAVAYIIRNTRKDS